MEGFINTGNMKVTVSETVLSNGMQFLERIPLTWTHDGKGFRNCVLI